MEYWQSLPKSGHRTDFYMPISVPCCTTKVFSRRCRAEKVANRLRLPHTLSHSVSDISCRIRRACDLALRSAADSGRKVTEEANALLKEATEMLGHHSERRLRLCATTPVVLDASIDLYGRDPLLFVYSKMETAKWKDSLERDWTYEVRTRIPFLVSRHQLCPPEI